MHRSIGFVIAVVPVWVPLVASGAPPLKPAELPVAARIETTLSTAADQIRQFAFDGDSDTFFGSEQSPCSTDHFTLVFDEPVAVKSIAVATGRPDGSDSLDAGTLEVSGDGKTFRALAKFAEGTAGAEPDGRKIQAVRVQPGEDMKHALAIRELTIVSEPAVAIFKYPVEIIVDVADAPEMKEWAENAARTCERAYPMINEELKSEGFKPRHMFTMSLKSDYSGIAAASGARITGSVKYFKEHPDDVGAMIHETVHIVQRYRSRNNPSWLVEGVSDYVRFFKYEPGNLGPINPDRAHYNRSYRVTAAFLAYLTAKYDKQIVLKLNKAMREGEYKEEIFKDLTGKTVQELDEEWRATLREQ
jgi:hypothetical protein